VNNDSSNFKANIYPTAVEMIARNLYQRVSCYRGLNIFFKSLKYEHFCLNTALDYKKHQDSGHLTVKVGGRGGGIN
jgi:hypothetical protein